MCTLESDYETAMTDCEKPDGTTHDGAVASRQNEFSSRQDLERALQDSRESEARLRKIVDTIPTLAWCNFADGSNDFVNQRWSDYTGLGKRSNQTLGNWVLTDIVLRPHNFYPGLSSPLGSSVRLKHYYSQE